MVTGSYRCAEIVTVSDATTNVLNDAPPSWAFITPSIAAYAETAGVEVRITRALHLGGRYWLGANGGSAELVLDDHSPRAFETKTTLEIPPGEHTVQLTGRPPDRGVLHIVFVAEDALVPERPFLAAPPEQPPASVSAISK